MRGTEIGSLIAPGVEVNSAARAAPSCRFKNILEINSRIFIFRMILLSVLAQEVDFLDDVEQRLG